MVCPICYDETGEKGVDVSFDEEPFDMVFVPRYNGDDNGGLGYIEMWYRCRCDDCGREGVGYKIIKVPEDYESYDFVEELQ